MEIYKFYKEDGMWFIDLPDYLDQGGSKGDLQMVLGADQFLDKLSKNKNIVLLHISTSRMLNYSGILFKKDEIPVYTGRYYQEIHSTSPMWLCDVTKFVFDGEFPDIIYFKIIE